MTSHDARNAVLNAVGETLFGFKTSLVASATVLTVLLRKYGASEQMIGALLSVETACCLLPQALGMYVFRSRRRLKWHLVLWHWLAMLPFILLMGLLTFHADAMSPAVYRWVMLGCWAGFCLAIGIVVAVWMDFIAHLFHSGIRGTAMGVASFGAAMGGTVAALLAAWMVASFPSPAVFAWLYVLAWVVATVSMALWLPVDDRVLRGLPDVPPPSFAGLAAEFRDSLGDRNYRAFLIGRVLAIVGFSIGPFATLYYQSAAGGGLSESVIIQCGAAATVGGAIGALVFGRIGDRFGHRLGVLLCTALQAVTLLTLFVARGPWGCAVSFACLGLAVAGGVPQNNLIFETCPHGRRTAHIVVSNLFIGIALGVAPLAGGFVAGRLGLQWLFGLSLAFSLLALAWFALVFREPRGVEARDAVQR